MAALTIVCKRLFVREELKKLLRSIPERLRRSIVAMPVDGEKRCVGRAMPPAQKGLLGKDEQRAELPRVFPHQAGVVNVQRDVSFERREGASHERYDTRNCRRA